MSKNKGFTLIELLVILAILGILGGVVIANFGDAKDRAGAQTEREYCNTYGNYRLMDRLPVKCFKYFQIDSSKINQQ